jgi:phosphate butyryltransferase
MIKSFEAVKEKVLSGFEKRTIAVAAAEDEDVLEAVKMAKMIKLADSILVGDKEKIIQIAEKIQLDLTDIEVIHEKDPFQAARTAVSEVRKGHADMLMKGFLSTSTFLRAVLEKDNGLRNGNLLSYLGIFEVPHFPRLLILTDCGMNIAPGLAEKIKIIENALQVTRALDIEQANVAVIGAVETVSLDMPVTLEAAALAKMSDRDQFKGAVIDGPLALDNAVSEEAARHKGIKSPIAGKADILLLPNIETGNALYKALCYLAYAQNAGIVLGATVPIVVTSRADSAQSKLNSIAMGLLISHKAK